MPLNAGNAQATQGMARDIFLALDAVLRPPLEDALEDPAEQLPPIQNAWRTLSFAVATGVVDHLERQPPGESEYAEAFSSGSHDAAFWNWFAGFAGVFRTWSSGAANVTQLHASLDSFLDSNPVPTQLRGVIR